MSAGGQPTATHRPHNRNDTLEFNHVRILVIVINSLPGSRQFRGHVVGEMRRPKTESLPPPPPSSVPASLSPFSPDKGHLLVLIPIIIGSYTYILSSLDLYGLFVFIRPLDDHRVEREFSDCGRCDSANHRP